MGIGSLQRKPVRGMILAFTATSSADLADIPATVIDIWPRLPSGNYVVVLEYGEPVRLGPHLITQIGALVSELYVPCRADQRWPQRARHRRVFAPAAWASPPAFFQPAL